MSLLIDDIDDSNDSDNDGDDNDDSVSCPRDKGGVTVIDAVNASVS